MLFIRIRVGVWRYPLTVRLGLLNTEDKYVKLVSVVISKDVAVASLNGIHPCSPERELVVVRGVAHPMADDDVLMRH